MSNDPASLPAIRVMLVDDHRTILWGLSRLIESAKPRMELVGSATSRSELLSVAAACRPDVILLDLDLAGESSSDALEDLKRICPAKILILTASHDLNEHQNAVLKGARGIVCKDETADVILRAIEYVHAGEVWINRHLMGKVLATMTSGESSAEPDPVARRIASLTDRERSIIRAVVEKRGAKGNAIAEELHISEHTLRNHLTVIYDKLRVSNRIDLYAFAVEHGLGTR